MEIRNSMIGIVVALSIIGFGASAYAVDVSCQLKAQDQVDVKILVGEKTIWAGTLAKAETKTVIIPEGAFTVISKVYNPNLERKGEIRATSHTNLCKENKVLAVPLFSSDQ
jgi:hypothetical protein